MKEYACIVGLEEAEAQVIAERLEMPVINHMILPSIYLRDGVLYVEHRGGRYVKVSKLLYHGVFDDDFDFFVGLALWNGACLPNPRAMLDCRLKFACLVRALAETRFGAPRGYAAPFVHYDATGQERVAKWGNWHCGENKERFTGLWQNENAAIIEPFIKGDAVRVVIIGNRSWQIKLEGKDWLKSIHAEDASFMPIDADLLADTEHLGRVFGLEMIANDYIIGTDGQKYLLEVNHIPNVTRFPEIWEAYCDYVVHWFQQTPVAQS